MLFYFTYKNRPMSRSSNDQNGSRHKTAQFCQKKCQAIVRVVQKHIFVGNDFSCLFLIRVEFKDYKHVNVCACVHVCACV